MVATAGPLIDCPLQAIGRVSPQGSSGGGHATDEALQPSLPPSPDALGTPGRPPEGLPPCGVRW
jgi:hypothetical protein